MEIVSNTHEVPSSDTSFTDTVTQLPGKLSNLLKETLTNVKGLGLSAKKEANTQTNNHALPYISASLKHITLETHDTKSYFFRSEIPLSTHKAGAHINIAFDANGETVKRTYTLSSSPKDSTEFSITVKRVNEGLASNWLFENLSAGDKIQVSQPQGHFVLPYQPAGKILMLSAGSGITPLMSMIRYLSETGNRSDIVFLNYSQTPNDIIFHDELNALTSKQANVKAHFVVEREASADTAHKGRINKKQLSEIVPDVLDREIYLCGPQPFMKAAVSILDKLKFNPSQLHLENFTADLSAATQLGYSAELSFASLESSIQSNPSNTILEEAEAAGLTPAAACRIGICRTCRCKKTSGTTVNLMTGEESSAEGDYILPCVSVAKTATSVEL